MATDLLEPIEAETKPLAHVQAVPGWLSIIDKMVDKGTDVTILSKVFELQQKAEAEMARKQFVESFAAFKAEAPAAIERTGKVGYEAKGAKVGYTHVELDVACKKLTPILSKHGLAHSWDTSQDDKGVITVSCRIEHVGGHAKIITLKGMADATGSKNSIQAVGSTIYYLQRYTLLAALGIAQTGDDDDGDGSTETLNEEQIRKIESVAVDCEKLGAPVNWEKFAAWIGFKTLDNIPRKEFVKVMTELERQKRIASERKAGKR